MAWQLHDVADLSGILLVLMTGIGGVKALLHLSSTTGQTLQKMETLEEGHEEIKADVKELAVKIERSATKEDLAIVRDDLTDVRNIAIGSSQGKRYPTKW